MSEIVVEITLLRSRSIRHNRLALHCSFGRTASCGYAVEGQILVREGENRYNEGLFTGGEIGSIYRGRSRKSISLLPQPRQNRQIGLLPLSSPAPGRNRRYLRRNPEAGGRHRSEPARDPPPFRRRSRRALHRTPPSRREDLMDCGRPCVF